MNYNWRIAGEKHENLYENILERLILQHCEWKEDIESACSIVKEKKLESATVICGVALKLNWTKMPMKCIIICNYN